MKKQTLFDLASMPKMILIITLIVMLGLLFGATSYLLKTPKTDLSIVNPVVETQCKIDSDCELVYVGDKCPPCDYLSEEYQCLNESEKIKIWNKQDKSKPIFACSSCEVEPDKYICKCENGKCEKVKIEEEKSGVDARCGEKVIGTGPCKRLAIGYEFDSNLEKCVEKRVSGCSFEILFESLEECQEVCEEKEDVALPDENELIKCNNNSDCVLVNSDCCGCSMGGGVTCINKKYLEKWGQKLKSDCKDNMACLAVYLCDSNPTGCECVNNVCQGVKGWEEI